MACDIHMYVEVKMKSAKGPKWEPIDPRVPCGCDDGLFQDPKTICWRCRGTGFTQNISNERNYNLFAILANVRNGWGFVGIKTGDGFVPISQPRGLPRDVTHKTQIQSEEWGVDGHSHSHLTLKELQEYDWHQSTWLEGVVSAGEFNDFRRTGRPNSWCGDVSGPNIKMISNEEMAQMIDSNQETYNHYTHVRWPIQYHESAGRFYTHSLPELERICNKFADGDRNRVRIVFWFDN